MWGSLGALVDSLLLPFWQNRAGHTASRLATCKNIRSAMALLEGTPHFGDLALAHCQEYLAAIDAASGRLPWARERAPADLQFYGSNGGYRVLILGVFVPRICGSYYTIPKAKVYLLKRDYTTILFYCYT